MTILLNSTHHSMQGFQRDRFRRRCPGATAAARQTICTYVMVASVRVSLFGRGSWHHEHPAGDVMARTRRDRHSPLDRARRLEHRGRQF